MVSRDARRRIAVLDRRHVVVGARIYRVGNVVLECATRRCTPVRHEPTIRGWSHRLRDCVRRGFRLHCIVGRAQEWRQLRVPASSACRRANTATIRKVERRRCAAVVVVGQWLVVGIRLPIDGDVLPTIRRLNGHRRCVSARSARVLIIGPLKMPHTKAPRKIAVVPTPVRIYIHPRGHIRSHAIAAVRRRPQRHLDSIDSAVHCRARMIVPTMR